MIRPTDQPCSPAPCRATGRRRRAATLTLFAACVLASAAQAGTPSVTQGDQVSRGEGERLRSIAARFGDFTLDEGSQDFYRMTLKVNGQAAGAIVIGLYHPGAERPRVRTAHYTVEIFNKSVETSDENAAIQANNNMAVLARAADAIADADGGALPETRVRVMAPPLGGLVPATEIMIAVAIAAGIWRRGRIVLDVRKPHIVQACAHTSIFLYWALYWPAVSSRAPTILCMIALAYACDAAFALLRFGSWRVGFSPLPVVLSTNLFVWLDPLGAVLAMTGAFASKTFVRRGERHIFNPSVAGLTIVAACTVLFPGLVHFGGLFHTLNVAPDMAEWVFLASLIPLTMFRLLPVSIGAIVGLYYITGASGAVRPTLLLMMTLLATDPATTPRSDVGRVLFGLLVGMSYIVYRSLFRSLHQPDDFAKILSVPLANILAPRFDTIAARLVGTASAAWLAFRGWVAARSAVAAARLQRLGARLVPVRPGAFVAAWILLFVIALHAEKPVDFEPGLHWTWGTPLVVRDSDDAPTCGANPVFCRPFSFVSEARDWLAWRGASGAAPGHRPEEREAAVNTSPLGP